MRTLTLLLSLVWTAPAQALDLSTVQPSAMVVDRTGASSDDLLSAFSFPGTTVDDNGTDGQGDTAPVQGPEIDVSSGTGDQDYLPCDMGQCPEEP